MSVYSADRRGQIGALINTAVFESMRGQIKSFSGAAVFTTILQVTVSGRGEPQRAWGQSATVNYFDVAEVPMLLGRGFGAHEEHSPDGSAGLWAVGALLQSRQRSSGDDGLVVREELMRPMLLESMLLSLGGGVFGV